ncbi:hypothetical protein O6H91_Y329900 [Diphasiastrum complanatum]|nr:hypothetical protein O6H91_Y329900 [Diphasiastrum complanatum]KAJ7285503.1 hypothetical protein O6H91_Y329900 [Diphasiastrum complanatum]
MIIRTYQRRSRGHGNGIGDSAYSTGDDGGYLRDSSSQDPPWSSSQESPFLTNPSSQDSACWSQVDFASAPDTYHSKKQGVESSFNHGAATSSRHKSNSQPLTKRDEEACFIGQKKRDESSILHDKLSMKRSKSEIENFGMEAEMGNPRLDWVENFGSRYGPLAPPTSTLMEAQESGEMMEHFDEANFAMDGLKPGQPLRVQRASMSSILSLCGSLQQRRLLRSHGLARPLLDAVVTLPVHDPSLALAAAAVLFFLAMDGQDEELLGSAICIRFLLKLLSSEYQAHVAENTSTFGMKLASLSSKLTRQKVNASSTGLDQGGTSVIAKVKALFASLKERSTGEGMQDAEQEQFSGDELSSKWLALLTLEKACLSTVVLEDTAGTVKKAGGQFKETLRELGGLNAISDLAADCLLNLKELLENGDSKPDSRLAALQKCEQSGGVSMLLRCLRVMENVTFLSEDNQKHLLDLKLVKGRTQSPNSFIALVLSAIKVCYELMHTFKKGRDVPGSIGGQRQTLYIACEEKEPSTVPEQTRLQAKIAQDDMSKDSKACQVVSYKSGELNLQVSSSRSFPSTSGKHEPAVKVSMQQNKHVSEKTVLYEFHGVAKVLGYQKNKKKSVAGLSALSASIKNSISMVDSSEPIDLEGMSKSFRFAQQLGSKSNRSRKNSEDMDFEDSQDPFAFDEDLDFGAKKQNKRTGKRRKPEKFISTKIVREPPGEKFMKGLSRELRGAETRSQSNGAVVGQEPTDFLDDTERSQYAPFAECLLSAVKVLMNLTNNNPDGCRQVAACGGLDTMATLVLGYCDKQKKSSELQKENVSAERVCFEEDLDLLVAVLGVLVNLIEKDDHIRARLASLNIPASTSPTSKNSQGPYRRDMISLLCLLFLSKQGAGEAAEAKEGKIQLEVSCCFCHG